MLMTHYREPIDFSVSRLEGAYRHWRNLSSYAARLGPREPEIPDWAMSIFDDLNTPSVLMTAFQRLNRQEPLAIEQSVGFFNLLGFEFADEIPDLPVNEIERYIEQRKELLELKKYKEADGIRDFLLNYQGIQLKDGKDPATGERVTTWEVKR